jgi:ssDNA-binding replication factor A large subunit
VDRWLNPDRDDPRAKLTQAQLGEVNEQARRLATELTGWSRAAVSRRLARKVVTGADITSAVVKVFEELQTAPGNVLPIGKLEEVDRSEVNISGRVMTLWKPSHPSIAQVGLVADESGRTRVTIWEKSDAPWVTEGEHVRIRGAARNWYEGRVSLAVTGSTTIEFPERGRWEE